MGTYSIALRVRRTIIQDAYISVPVTEAILNEQPDGTARINSEALFAEGIRISAHHAVEWQNEALSTDIHPIQQAAPEGRKSFDAFYSNRDQ